MGIGWVRTPFFPLADARLSPGVIFQNRAAEGNDALLSRDSSIKGEKKGDKSVHKFKIRLSRKFLNI